MVRALKLALLNCWVFASLNANAQQFECGYVKNIYEKLPENIKSTSSGFIKSFPVKIFKQNDIITNAGIELTSALPKEYALAESFLSRFLLELVLSNNHKEVVRVLEHNKTLLFFNGNDFIKGPYWDVSIGLDLLRDYNRFDITRDSLFYYAQWSDSNGKLSVRIPSNVQILTGKDKPELEDSFVNLLLRHDIFEYDTRTVDENSLAEVEGVFIEKNKFFFVEDMNNSKYYYKDLSGKFNPIFSPDHAGESFSNLFHETSVFSDNIKLHISQQLYGKQTKQYEIPLNNFVSFAKENGFEIFVGLENVSDMVIEATVILKNKELNFIHVLHVKSDQDTLFNATAGAIAARLYTYIPSDNIVNLFEEYKPRPRYDELIPYLK